MDEKMTPLHHELTSLVQEVRTVLESARQKVAQQVNNELLNTYWSIGRIICEYEQTSPERARLWQADLEGAFQGTHKGVWQRLFPFEPAEYAAVLPDI